MMRLPAPATLSPTHSNWSPKIGNAPGGGRLQPSPTGNPADILNYLPFASEIINGAWSLVCCNAAFDGRCKTRAASRFISDRTGLPWQACSASSRLLSIPISRLFRAPSCWPRTSGAEPSPKTVFLVRHAALSPLCGL